MRDFFEQIRSSLEHRLYYLALLSSLAVPDICGVISEPKLKVGKRYAKWFDEYVLQKYSDGEKTWLDGETCYYLRCSMLHQGTTLHEKNILFRKADTTTGKIELRHDRIIFIEPPHGFHRNFTEGALIFRIDNFCNDILESAEEWLKEYEMKEGYQNSFGKFMRRYPNGIEPYIIGLPVIT